MFPLHLESQADQTDEKSQKMHAQWMARNLAVELLVLHTAPSCLAQKKRPCSVERYYYFSVKTYPMCHRH